MKASTVPARALLLALAALLASCGDDAPDGPFCWREEVEEVECTTETPDTFVVPGATYAWPNRANPEEVPGIDFDCHSTVELDSEGCGQPDAVWVYGEGVDSTVATEAGGVVTLEIWDELLALFEGDSGITIEVRRGRADGRSCVSAAITAPTFIDGGTQVSSAATLRGDVLIARFDELVVATPTSYDATQQMRLAPAVLVGKPYPGHGFLDGVLTGAVDLDDAAEVIATEPMVSHDGALGLLSPAEDLDLDGDGLCESGSMAFVLQEPESGE